MSSIHEKNFYVNHDPEFADNTDRIIEMEDGRIIRM
jgi:ABC-type lipoprotein export system ATPase subunit